MTLEPQKILASREIASKIFKIRNPSLDKTSKSNRVHGLIRNHAVSLAESAKAKRNLEFDEQIKINQIKFDEDEFSDSFMN